MTKVAVIGSGPTGSIAALQLARGGYDVKLFDSKEFPRHKLCGGGLSYRTLSIMKHLGIDMPDQEIYPYITPIYDYIVSTIINSKLKEIRHRRQDSMISLSNRYDYDAYIREAVIGMCPKITPITDKILDISSLLDQVVLTGEKTRYVFDYAVFSNGSGSKFGKLAHGSLPPTEEAVACETIVSNPAKSIVGVRPLEYINIITHPTFDSMNVGYSWMFARSETINVGTGVIKSYDKHLPFYKSWVKRVSESEYDVPIDNLDHHWTIPMFKHGRSMNITDNAIVIGDALGLVDNFTGEGISAGMLSAIHAAEYLSEHESFRDITPAFYNLNHCKDQKYSYILGKLALSNYIHAFNMLEDRKAFDMLIEVMAAYRSAKSYISWVKSHHPIDSFRLYIDSLMSSGRDEKGLRVKVW